MTFENLNPTLQNMILYNHDYMMKVLFLFLFIGISVFYLFYYKPKIETKTIFWSVMLVRTIITGFSFFGLILSPYLLLTLDPTYSFQEFFAIYGIIYGLLLVMIGFVITLDFYKWIIIWFLRMTGFNTKTDQYYKFQKWVKTYLKHE